MPDENDDPLFSLDDYVPAGGSLPDHLKGKSAEEVAQYYSDQLRIVADKVGEKPPKKETPSARTTTTPLTEADVAPALGTMIASAKMVAKASLDDDQQKLFARFAPEITNIMNAGFRGVQLADAQNWIFAFNQVLGSKSTLLMKEARDAEVSRRTAESSSGGTTVEEKEVELTGVQTSVADSLGIGKDGYKQGLKIMREDKWPLTFSNR